MSNSETSSRLSFGNNLFMSYDPTSVSDDTSDPLDSAMNNKIPQQIFEIVPADNNGNIALKTSNGHYVTFNKNVTETKDKINFGTAGDPNLILVEQLGNNKVAFKTRTIGYVMANSGGGLKPNNPNWCFSTEATTIGEQQKFQITNNKPETPIKRNQYTFGFVVDPTEAIKNEKNEIIISYADLGLSGKPMVFLTPFLPSGYPKAIPTVVRVGNTHITIRDENIIPSPPAGYRLNILVVDPNPGSFNNAMLYPKQVPKTSVGRLHLDTDEVGNVAFLTPFWDGGNSVGSVETINREQYDPEVYGFLNTYTNSNNAMAQGPTKYSVNYLSVRSQSESLERGTNGGLWKEKSSIISFTSGWEHNPCVILTPHMGDDAIAKSLPFVTHFENNCVGIKTANPEITLKVNYMAVPQDVPRMGTNHKLNEAFEHIYTHMPEHKAHIDPFRSEFENIILRGAEPSEALKDKVFDFTPSFPENRNRAEPSEVHIAMATVIFDAAALLINAIAAIKVGTNSAAIKAIASDIKYLKDIQNARIAAGEISETTPLIEDVIEDFAGSAQELKDMIAEGEFHKEVLEEIAFNLKAFAIFMTGTGFIKSVFVAIFKEFDMPIYKWVITITTIVAQVLAFALSGGAALIAWFARIVGLLLSAVTLGLDSYDLYMLEYPGKKKS